MNEEQLVGGRWRIIGGLLIPLMHVQFAAIRRDVRWFRKDRFILEIQTDLGRVLCVLFSDLELARGELQLLAEAVEGRG